MARYELKTFEDIYTAVMEELKLQSSDDTSLNRIKRIINMVYLDEVVPFDDWKWSRGKISLPIESRFATGTASCTQYSTTVTLSSAPGPSKKGQYFSVDGQQEIYVITSHAAGSTTVELETPFIASTLTTYTFKIWSDSIPLPVDCEGTFEVRHDYHNKPLEGKGLQEYRRLVQPSPKAEGYPFYYSTDDFVDPTPFSTISSLPALTSRASAGQVKTLVFASTVAALIVPGDRIQVTGAGHYSYNGEFQVTSVSTTTVTYTGPLEYDEVATVDASLLVKLSNAELSDERYRSLLIYPCIFDKRINLRIDYHRQPLPLVEDDDEPIIPLPDRIVLFYGALMLAWSSIGRNPEEAQRNATLFDRKLSRMAGKMDDSTDLPQIKPSLTYLRAKRTQRRGRESITPWMGSGIGSTGSSSSSTTPTGLANSVATFNNSSELEGSTDITTTELGYLDGVTSPVQTQLDAITTLADGKIYLGNSSNVATEVTPSGDITMSNAGVTDITAGVIVNADINASAAIARSKIAAGTADHVVINAPSTGVLSSEAALSPVRGGTGIANNAASTLAISGNFATTVTVTNPTAVTLPTSGTLATRAGTENLTNKTLDNTNTISLKDTLFTVQDDGDATKLLAFQCSGIGTGTTKTITMPNANVDLGNLTNSNISSSAAIALSKLAGLTVQSKATTYTILITDDLVLADTSGGAWTATLPAASGQIKVIRVKKTTADFSALTIARAGSDTISDLTTGLTSTTLNSVGEEVYLINDGTSIWHVIERRIPSVWTSYTPTGAWSANTTYTGMYKRNGDSISCRIKVACSGAPTTASLTVNIFSGAISTLTIDTTKLPSTSITQQLGQLTINDSDTTIYEGTVVYSSTTAVSCKHDGGSTLTQTTQAAPFTFGASDYVTLEVMNIPVTGWNA